MNKGVAQVSEILFGSGTPEKMAAPPDMWGDKDPDIDRKFPDQIAFL